MGLGATVVLQLALLATSGETYAEAHKATTEKGCPLVVVVGATWCPACQQMKTAVLPEVKRRGILQKVAYAEVDMDEDRELGAELTDGGPIPQILVYRKTQLGWRLKRLIGGQDVRAVEDFIAQGVKGEKEKDGKEAAAKKDSAEKSVKAKQASVQAESQTADAAPTK
jgi:thioredoxin-like negative regulator of GroEL